MVEEAMTMVTLGALLLMGLATDWLGHRTALPRVTLLLLFGFLIGPGGLDVLPNGEARWLPLVANMALVMVGFVLGGQLTVRDLRIHGRAVLSISVGEVIATACVIFGGLALLGVPIDLALLLAGIGTATDPAATVAVTQEVEADGPFTRILLGVVAVDDAWGLIAFSILLGLSEMLSGVGGGLEALRWAGWEIGGALALGVVLGFPMAKLSGRIRPGEPTLLEALGMVFLAGGLALWLEVSFLLTSMTLGAIVANFARHHTRPFHAIEGVEWPFLVIFFVFAGSLLDIGTLAIAGPLLIANVALRVVGRFVGGWVGAAGGGTSPEVRRWIGPALMPQAGVAMGMALLAAQRLPHRADALIPIVVATTVFFEIAGPVLTRLALVRVGETGRAGLRPDSSAEGREAEAG